MENNQTAQKAKIQSRIGYVKGFEIAGGEKVGLLEWGADDRIRLFDIDRATGQSKGVMFDVTTAEIAKVSGFSSSLTLKLTDGTKYTLNFSAASAYAVAGLGVAGMALSSEINKAAGVNKWLEDLRSHGVTVSYLTFMKVALFTVIGIVALALIIYFTT